MKEAAGAVWTKLDPWHSGGGAHQFRFLENFTVQHVQQSNDQHSKPFLPQNMTWRFISEPMDSERRPSGSYIRISFNGRDVPTYHVRRDPLNKWGFIMENCWGLFASFDLPEKGTEPLLEDSYMRLSKENQKLESLFYNNGFNSIPEGPGGLWICYWKFFKNQNQHQDQNHNAILSDVN
mmetsp:Transcript_8648/g.19003  ORF Transcript_8648/g.19003 Transcript_8648/m.19003 type:complete len:179 (+) Transcript_8648:195-731(+)